MQEMQHRLRSLLGPALKNNTTTNLEHSETFGWCKQTKIKNEVIWQVAKICHEECNTHISYANIKLQYNDIYKYIVYLLIIPKQHYSHHPFVVLSWILFAGLQIIALCSGMFFLLLGNISQLLQPFSSLPSWYQATSVVSSFVGHRNILTGICVSRDCGLVKSQNQNTWRCWFLKHFLDQRIQIRNSIKYMASAFPDFDQCQSKHHSQFFTTSQAFSNLWFCSPHL